jgi:hypothetical protein
MVDLNGHERSVRAESRNEPAFEEQGLAGSGLTSEEDKGTLAKATQDLINVFFTPHQISATDVERCGISETRLRS